MGEDPGTDRAQVTSTEDPEQIQRDIEATREQLGDTVEALAHRADVKAQAKQKIEDTKAAASAKKDQLVGKAREVSPENATTAATQASQKARENPLPLAVIGAFGAGFLAGRLMKR
jgi:ElaB/YqjD/DUF883 family membrane-anchored ribosome-binding protein